MPTSNLNTVEFTDFALPRMLNKSLYSLLQLPINHRLRFATRWSLLAFRTVCNSRWQDEQKAFFLSFFFPFFKSWYVANLFFFNSSNEHISYRNGIRSYALISYSELSSSSIWWPFQGSHSNSVFFPKSLQIKCIIHINNVIKLCISALPFLNCFWLCKAFLCNSFYGNVYSSNWI